MRSPIRLLIALAAAALVAAPAAAQSVSLTILHTNDTHGHLLPFSYPDAAASGGQLQGLRAYRNIGGIARRATLVRRLRQELEARKVAVWLADVGDYSDGTPFSTEYHGEADVAAMNAVGYDLGTLGNHEFNYPAAQVRKLIGLSKYVLVNANATDRTTSKPLLPRYVVRQVGPVRVAVFGLITREAATYPAGKEAFDVADEVQSAKQVVAELRSKADIIILLSHAGESLDERIAAEVPEIDVIVGGHSHSRLPSGDFVWRSEDLRSSSSNGTVIVAGAPVGRRTGPPRSAVREGREGRMARGSVSRPPDPRQRGHPRRPRRGRGGGPVLEADRVTVRRGDRAGGRRVREPR